MKKYIVLGVMILVLGAGAYVALANDSGNSNNNGIIINTGALVAPMMINIGPNGNAMLRGEVTSVGTDSLVVKNWGHDWTVKVSSTTQVISANRILTDFKAGDFIGVIGDVSADGNFIIDAKILRTWGQKPDSDKDGIPDNQDNDDDNDGMDNMHDMHRRDHNNDGMMDIGDFSKGKDGNKDSKSGSGEDN